MSCRINKRRLWQSRIMLEACMHPAAWFVTLTYNDQNLPEGGSLVPRDLQLFLKRLRERYGKPLRFYAVGEYGRKTWRPHYHLVLFGLDQPGLVEKCWCHGFVQVGPLSAGGAAYVAGYVTKKMTKDQEKELGERVPEFARMSLKPGIGAEAMEKLARWYHTAPGCREFQVNGLPLSVRQQSGLWPLGRYLRQVLREYITGSRERLDFEKAMDLMRQCVLADQLTGLDGMGRMVSPEIEQKREVTELRARQAYNTLIGKGSL